MEGKKRKIMILKKGWEERRIRGKESGGLPWSMGIFVGGAVLGTGERMAHGGHTGL